MKYLLIAFVVFLALAPLTHFIPSKRQRMVARLRESAAVSGLFVEFRKPPARDGRTVPDAGSLIFYGRRLPHGRGPAPRYTAFVRDDWGWRGLDRPAEPPEPLLDLPEEVALAMVDEGSCGVYWNEEGGQEVLDRICQVLERWSEDLRPGKPSS